MRKCRFCGKEIQDASRVCEHCGRDLIPGRPPELPKEPTASGSSSPGASLGAKCCLCCGILLSFLMIVPALRYGGLFLFPFVAAPFFVFAVLFRRGLAASRTMLMSLPYLAVHSWLVYTYLDPGFRPQEFGYLGLVMLPVFESVVGVPIGVILIFVVERLAMERGA